jgi:hypothetical protein
LDPYGRVTWANDLELNRCSLAQVTVDLGENREYAVTDL